MAYRHGLSLGGMCGNEPTRSVKSVIASLEREVTRSREELIDLGTEEKTSCCERVLARWNARAWHRQVPAFVCRMIGIV